MSTPNLGLLLPVCGTVPGIGENFQKIDTAVGNLQAGAGSAGRQIQTARQQVIFLKNTQADYAVSFPEPFADADFTVSANIEFPDLTPTNPGQVTFGGFVRSPANDGITIMAKNISNTDYPGVVHVIAIHD